MGFDFRISLTEPEEARRTTKILEADLLKKGQIDCAKVYPEFYLREPYGVWNQIAPVPAFLPFYKTIIVLVEPFQDQSVFKQYYGIELKDLVALRRENRVVTLAGNYREYPAWYEDFFAMEHVPSWGRVQIAIQHALSGSVDQVAGIDQLFSRVTLGGISESLIDLMGPTFRNLQGDPKQNFIMSEKARARRLYVLGYSELLNQLVAVDDQNVFLFLIYLCDSMISWPVHFSLGGYTNHDISWALLGKLILADMRLRDQDMRLVLSNECLLGQGLRKESREAGRLCLRRG